MTTSETFIPTQDDGAPAGVHRRWAVVTAALTMAVTTIPYIVGFAMSQGRHFMWLGYNLDDSCVYLSWMRQAADGASKTLNLFTTDPQHGMAPNPLFWLLGRIAGITHIPLIAVYHGARLACGFALLMMIWELIHTLIAAPTTQRLGFLFVCFSAGLGWLPVWHDHTLLAPIDTWQPEAITFLSLYLSPLFCFSMLLQVSIVHTLLLGERTGKFRYALYAGLCGLVLGLTHTYDVITVSAIWLTYLVALTANQRLFQRERWGSSVASWIRGIVAGLITLPAVLYIAHQLRTETVFRQRAMVETTDPTFYWFWILSGYGMTLLLAVLGAAVAVRHSRTQVQELNQEVTAARQSRSTGADAVLLLIVWTAVNLACAYVPVAFQRKMLQGTHIPIGILAGIGAAWVITHLRQTRTHHRFPLFAFVATAALVPSNLKFMLRDIANFDRNRSQTELQRTYLQPGEILALEWIRNHSTQTTAIQPMPWVGLVRTDTGRKIYARDAALMCFSPGLIDRPVYCGHWGETPDFQTKLAELYTFATWQRDDAQRISLLRRMNVRYLLFTQKRSTDLSSQDGEDADELLAMFRGRVPMPKYLQLKYQNVDADVYEVTIP